MNPVDYNALATQYEAHRRINPDVFVRLTRGLETTAAVLEVGCGTGNYIAEIATAIGCRCTGIDPSEEMVSRARSRCPSSVTILSEAAEALSLDEASFDSVFNVDVVHHLSDRLRAFAEAFRVLRPGAAFCVVTDSEWVIRNHEPLSEYFPETVEFELQRCPSIEKLQHELREAGFTAIRDELAQFEYMLTTAAPYEARVFSSLLYISAEAHQRGVARLQERLAKGPLPCTSRYFMLWAERPTATRGG
jgi:ubiquinone/menaquinone biosynthesis C-methylase UbiE